MLIRVYLIIRPKIDNEVYGFMMCGDYQFKVVENDESKQNHTWFRIPCIGNTWTPCTEWTTEWDCPVEVDFLLSVKYKKCCHVLIIIYLLDSLRQFYHQRCQQGQHLQTLCCRISWKYLCISNLKHRMERKNCKIYDFIKATAFPRI